MFCDRLEGLESAAWRFPDSSARHFESEGPDVDSLRGASAEDRALRAFLWLISEGELSQLSFATAGGRNGEFQKRESADEGV